MLGRLEMDVDSCIDAYIHLSKSIFETKQKSRFNLFGRGKDAILVNGKFSSQRLEDAIKQITEEHTKNSEAPLWNPGGKCKVYSLSTNSITARNLSHILDSSALPGRKTPRRRALGVILT